MAQPTGWSPDPISDQSLISAGSSLVPLPDVKRVRQGEAMPVVVVSGAPSGCQEVGPSRGSDSSDSDLDENAGVEELILIAAMASEQRLDPGHAGGEDYQGGLIEASTENRERLVGASLESLELAQARRAAELNTTAGIAAEFAADLNVPAGISGKPNSLTHSTLCTYNYEYSFTTCSRCCCRAWGCFTSQRNQKKTRTRYCCHIVTSASCCNGEMTVRIFIFFSTSTQGHLVCNKKAAFCRPNHVLWHSMHSLNALRNELQRYRKNCYWHQWTTHSDQVQYALISRQIYSHLENTAILQLLVVE